MKKRCGPARLQYQQGVPILTLSGSHEEMGYQYGFLLKEELRRAVPRLLLTRDAFLRLVPAPLRPFARLFLFLRMKTEERSIPKKFRDELRGVSLGSGQPFSVLLTISTFAEVLMNIGCVSLIARTPKGILHSRNLDFTPLDLGTMPVIVNYRPVDGISHTLAGFLGYLPGLTGMNEAGLSFSVNEVSVSGKIRTRGPHGMILGYLVRNLLENARSISDCSTGMKNYRSGQGWTLAVASAGENTGAIFDVTPAGTRRHPLGNRKFLFSLNDFMFGKNRVAFEPVTRGRHGINIARRSRADIIAGRVRDPRTAFDFLSDSEFYGKPDAVGESTLNNTKTLQSVVMDAARGEIILSSAPGYAAAGQVIRLNVKTGKSSLYRRSTKFLKRPDVRKLTDWLILLYRDPGAAYRVALDDDALLPYQMEALMFLSRSFGRFPLIPEKLLPSVRRLQKIYPQSAAPVFWEAELARRNGQRGNALRLYRAALEKEVLFPSDEVFCRYGLSQCLMSFHQTVNAVSEARKALKLLSAGCPDRTERKMASRLRKIIRNNP